MNGEKEFEYHLNRRGKAYVIHRMEYENGIGVGTRVFQSYNYEEARKELYRLNGWKYKPKKQE